VPQRGAEQKLQRKDKEKRTLGMAQPLLEGQRAGGRGASRECARSEVARSAPQRTTRPDALTREAGGTGRNGPMARKRGGGCGDRMRTGAVNPGTRAGWSGARGVGRWVALLAGVARRVVGGGGPPVTVRGGLGCGPPTHTSVVRVCRLGYARLRFVEFGVCAMILYASMRGVAFLVNWRRSVCCCSTGRLSALYEIVRSY